MLLAAVLVIAAGVAFVRSMARPTVEYEEPLSPDSKVLLKPFDVAMADLDALATGGSEASLVAAEGKKAVQEARREAYRLALRRQKLVRDRGRAGVAGETYAETISRIDAVLDKLAENVRETQTEIHRLSAKEGDAPETESAIGDLRAVLMTARELRGDETTEVRA